MSNTYEFTSEHNNSLMRRTYIDYEESMPAYICTIRTNDETNDEMMKYLKAKKSKYTRIYNSPVPIKNKLLPDRPIFLLELNTSNNTISGIGLIYNKPKTKTHDIHKNHSVNRFSFEASHRIDRSEIRPHEKQFVDFLEDICMFGKYNVKKTHGINKFPTKYQYNANTRLDINILACMQEMFRDRGFPFDNSH